MFRYLRKKWPMWKQYQDVSSRAQDDLDNWPQVWNKNHIFALLSFVSQQHQNTQISRSVLLWIFSPKWTYGHAGQPCNFPGFLPNCLLGTFVSPFIFSDPPLIYLMDWSFYQRGLRIYPPQNYRNRVYVVRIYPAMITWYCKDIWDFSFFFYRAGVYWIYILSIHLGCLKGNFQYTPALEKIMAIHCLESGWIGKDAPLGN